MLRLQVGDVRRRRCEALTTSSQRSVAQAVGDQVVDDAALRRSAAACTAPGACARRSRSLDSTRCRNALRAVARDLELAHVRDVEDAGARAHGAVLLGDADVVDRHLPAGERHHAGAELDVAGVQRRAPERGAHVPLRLDRRPGAPKRTSWAVAFAARASSGCSAPMRQRKSNSSRRWVRIISGPSVETVTAHAALEEGAEDAHDLLVVAERAGQQVRGRADLQHGAGVAQQPRRAPDRWRPGCRGRCGRAAGARRPRRSRRRSPPRRRGS